jgi:hypothetical protein
MREDFIWMDSANLLFTWSAFSVAEVDDKWLELF